MSLLPPHLPSPAPTPDEMQISPADLAHPEADQAKIRSEVETLLLRLSQDLYEMEICAGEVVPGMEGLVPNYLRKVNEAFIELSEKARDMTDSVPRQVIENVDHHRNPHTYTKNALTRATGENQYALGRALGLESFRRQLHSAISENFPAVPLPERRHRPLEGSDATQEEDRGRANGEAGLVKTESGRDFQAYEGVDTAQAGRANQFQPFGQATENGGLPEATH